MENGSKTNKSAIVHIVTIPPILYLRSLSLSMNGILITTSRSIECKINKYKDTNVDKYVSIPVKSNKWLEVVVVVELGHGHCRGFSITYVLLRRNFKLSDKDTNPAR